MASFRSPNTGIISAFAHSNGIPASAVPSPNMSSPPRQSNFPNIYPSLNDGRSLRLTATVTAPTSASTKRHHRKRCFGYGAVTGLIVGGLVAGLPAYYVTQNNADGKLADQASMWETKYNETSSQLASCNATSSDQQQELNWARGNLTDCAAGYPNHSLGLVVPTVTMTVTATASETENASGSTSTTPGGW